MTASRRPDPVTTVQPRRRAADQDLLPAAEDDPFERVPADDAVDRRGRVGPRR